MTQQHPITPPPELQALWMTEARSQDYCSITEQVAFHAAQWGADQELEAYCQALYDRYDSVRRATGFPGSDMSDWLRAARRPNLKSLKEQALEELDAAILRGDCLSTSPAKDIIRRALEQLDD